MKKAIFLSMTLLFIVSLAGIYTPPQAKAGYMTLPGGWEITITYCTNGIIVDLTVPASITAGVTHRARVTGINPSIDTSEDLYKFFSADGVGGFAVRRYYYWDAVQLVGTNVTGNSVRWEDTTRINANNSDFDTVGDCLVPPYQLTPAHKAHTTDTTPTFTWHSALNADNYRIWVYNDNRVYSLKVRTIGNGATTFTWEENLAPGKYYWRLRSRDANSLVWSDWSNRYTLFVD